VRDVCANRTPRQDRVRQRGKSGMLDSERIAQETLAHPLPPNAFKRAGQDQEGPDELHQLLALWHNRRRSILTSRQHLVNEAEHLLCELREQLPDSKAVRPRLAALQRRNRRRRYDPPTRLCLEILDRYHAQIKPLDREEKQVTAALEALVRQSGSTLGELCGLSPPGRSPSCWSRPATPAASPRAAFAASMPRPRCQPRPRKDPASLCVTATAPAATGASTRSCTGWPSPSCAASRAPRSALDPVRVSPALAPDRLARQVPPSLALTGSKRSRVADGTLRARVRARRRNQSAA
jgi:hypothetical protein